MPNPPRTLIIGLSGPSSSGKTTLARLLREIFTIPPLIKLFILHEDDFYKTDADIPLVTITSPSHGTRTLQDWDCVESLDLDLLSRAIRHVKTHGRVPDDLDSKEDQNSVGEVGVDTDEIRALRDEVRAWSDGIQAVTICVLDGFLLFPDPESQGDMGSLCRLMREVLDRRVFLTSSKARTVERRGRRSGYVTLEGFWEDPPGYVEEVVWVNYERDHGWLFEKGDADEGRVNREGEKVRREGILVGPGCGEVQMRELVRWGVEVVKDLIDGVDVGKKGEGEM